MIMLPNTINVLQQNKLIKEATFIFWNQSIIKSIVHFVNSTENNGRNWFKKEVWTQRASRDIKNLNDQIEKLSDLLKVKDANILNQKKLVI